jgi:hypothetical protein
MPVHHRVNVKRILDHYLYFIGAAQTDDRSEDGSRIAIGPCRLGSVPSRCGPQFYRVSFFGRVDQPRDVQGAVEVCRLALREVGADEGRRQRRPTRLRQIRL